jgi:phosphatidylglycerophosphatase A
MRLPLSHPAALIATWFGSGLLRPASGTWGSAAALPFAWALLHFSPAGWGWLVLLFGALAVFGLGLWAAGVYQRHMRAEDPSDIVIDEVAGQWLALMLADPQVWWHFAAGFLLFRLFDVVKVWPASWFDRRSHRSFGVMADDMVAGAYALVVLLMLQLYFAP